MFLWNQFKGETFNDVRKALAPLFPSTANLLASHLHAPTVPPLIRFFNPSDLLGLRRTPTIGIFWKEWNILVLYKVPRKNSNNFRTIKSEVLLAFQ